VVALYEVFTAGRDALGFSVGGAACLQDITAFFKEGHYYYYNFEKTVSYDAFPWSARISLKRSIML